MKRVKAVEACCPRICLWLDSLVFKPTFSRVRISAVPLKDAAVQKLSRLRKP
jgi:hypothetical protein